MTKEQTFFFQVLRDHLQGRVTQDPGALDWSSVVAWAESHKLGGIFFVQCGPLLSREPALRGRLSTGLGTAVFHAANLQADYAQLRQALAEGGVPFIPVKGALISGCYPEPDLRTMGDLDLLVRREDRERIRDLLLPLGFVNKKWSEEEWDYEKGTSLFELQAILLDDHGSLTEAMDQWFNDFWPHAAPGEDGVWALDWSFHTLYLMAHLAKHLRWVGAGYRQFYDLAVVMLRGHRPIRWDWIRQQAEAVGFFPFVANCLALNERWFGVPSPYEENTVTEELFEAVTEKIFADGVFGFRNRDNDAHDLSAALEKDPSMSFGRAKLRTARTLAFPPYRDLITSPKYAYLRGKPWLLPAAWAHRAIRGSRGSVGANNLKAVLRAQEETLEERAEQLKKLGL